jgi:uncharacterized protein (TIGR03083 family)
MDRLRPAGSLDVIRVLREERAAFLRLLGSLNPQEWDAQTECPAWSVKGIALHVLGDDFSLLSRQRDEATDSLTLLADEEPEWDFRQRLDSFNERWVHQAGFMSTALVIELLGLTGDRTAEFYAAVDHDQLGEPVGFVGPDPAPYWMIAAREYAERWIHHLQVARASSRPGPTGGAFVEPAVAALMRGFPAAMSLLPADVGTQVRLGLGSDGPAWTLVKEAGGWRLYDGSVDKPTAGVELSVEVAAGLFSRGLDREAILRQVVLQGEGHLPNLLAEGLVAFFARDAGP